MAGSSQWGMSGETLAQCHVSKMRAGHVSLPRHTPSEGHIQTAGSCPQLPLGQGWGGVAGWDLRFILHPEIVSQERLLGSLLGSPCCYGWPATAWRQGQGSLPLRLCLGPSSTADSGTS